MLESSPFVPPFRRGVLCCCCYRQEESNLSSTQEGKSPGGLLAFPAPQASHPIQDETVQATRKAQVSKLGEGGSGPSNLSIVTRDPTPPSSRSAGPLWRSWQPSS